MVDADLVGYVPSAVVALSVGFACYKIATDHQKVSGYGWLRKKWSYWAISITSTLPMASSLLLKYFKEDSVGALVCFYSSILAVFSFERLFHGVLDPAILNGIYMMLLGSGLLMVAAECLGFEAAIVGLLATNAFWVYRNSLNQTPGAAVAVTVTDPSSSGSDEHPPVLIPKSKSPPGSPSHAEIRG